MKNLHRDSGEPPESPTPNNKKTNHSNKTVVRRSFTNGHKKITNVPYTVENSQNGLCLYIPSTVMYNIASISKHMAEKNLNEYNHHEYENQEKTC